MKAPNMHWFIDYICSKGNICSNLSSSVKKESYSNKPCTDFTHYSVKCLIFLHRLVFVSFLVLLITVCSLIISVILSKTLLYAVMMIWDNFWCRIRMCVTFSVVPMALGGNEARLVNHCQLSLLTRPSAVLTAAKLWNQHNPPTSGADLWNPILSPNRPKAHIQIPLSSMITPSLYSSLFFTF